MLDFSVSLDRMAKVLTALVFVLLAVTVVIAQSLIVAAAGCAALLIAYSYSPRGYAVVEGAIQVRRRMAGEVRIPLASLREVRRASFADLRCAIRLWASGGLFGYYGWFRTGGLGPARWYVTNRSKSVVVVSDAGTYVLSPDDVEGFLAAVRPYSIPAQPDAPPPRRRGLPLAAWAGIGLGVAAIAALVWALRYSPGPPRYTLASDSLTIHDRFYPVTLRAEAVDVGAIRVLDPSVERLWRVTARTNGFSNSNYSSGWFRVAGGEKVRLYRARGTRLVLLPPKGEGTPVLYGLHDPDRFIHQVRQAWSHP